MSRVELFKKYGFQDTVKGSIKHNKPVKKVTVQDTYKDLTQRFINSGNKADSRTIKPHQVGYLYRRDF